MTRKRMSITNGPCRIHVEFRVYDTDKGMRVASSNLARINKLKKSKVRGVTGKSMARCHVMTGPVNDVPDYIIGIIYLSKEHGLPQMIENVAHELAHVVDYMVKTAIKLKRISRYKDAQEEAAAQVLGGLMYEFYTWAVTCKYDFEKFNKAPESISSWSQATWKEVK